MGNFNRDRSGGGRGFSRGGGFSAKGGPSSGWNDRGSRGPVEMHQAVCDNCKKNCEVPFRPTSGKPVFCSSCFENNRGSGSDSRRFESRSSEDRQMFDAVCNECGNSCKVPFQPSGGKPVYCSNCFGVKKGAGNRENGQSQSQPQYTEQFEALNSKLDRILSMLTPSQKPTEQVEVLEEEKEVVKKKPSKKKSAKE